MDVLEATRQLGKAIQEDPRYAAFAAARLKNDQDEALQENIGKFNLVRMSLDNELSKDEQNQDKIKEYNEELKKVYGMVMTNPSMIAYNEAKSAMDQLLAQINDLVTQCVNGEDPDTAQPSAGGCSGSCASCSGCH